MAVQKTQWKVDIIHCHMLGTAPNCFPTKIRKIGAKQLVSILDIVNGDWTIGNQLFTYHSLVITFAWVADHALESAGFVGLEDFTFGIAFKIFGNGIDEHCSGGGGKIRDISTVEVIPDVPKLDVAEAGGDDEGALAVAIVPDVVDGVGVVE